MATKKNALIAGLVFTVVVGVIAITYISNNRAPAQGEHATGTIGAADRHRAEQISEEDVILDIPGHAEVSVALLELLSDEQRADLLDRMGTAARTEQFNRFEISEAAYARMSNHQKAGLVRSLDSEARTQLAAKLGFDLAALDRMDSADLAAAVDRLGSRVLLDSFGELPFTFTELVYMRMSQEQKAYVVRSLATEARADLAAKMGTDVASLDRMDSVSLAEAVDRLGVRALQEAEGQLPFTFSDLVYERMSVQQRFNLVRALATEARTELAAAMQIDLATLDRMDAASLDKSLASLRSRSVLDAFGELPFTFSNLVYQRMDTSRRAGVMNALGATAFNEARHTQMAFAQLDQQQSRALWDRLSEVGRSAALRFSGLAKADIDQMNFEQRAAAYERSVQQRVAR